MQSAARNGKGGAKSRGYKLANDGQDTRRYRSISAIVPVVSTQRYTAPSPHRFRKVYKRCYELSFKTLFDIADAGKADGVTLVHGTVLLSGTDLPIGHAWLESDIEAYDAVDHVTMPIDQYVAERGAVVERRYSIQEIFVILRTLNRRHHGP